MAVIDGGNLNAAVRASMSVPGVFAPQELNGRLLVDGGLVRNLGVDVARQLGATRVIAVNLGTPLSGRDELRSLVGVAGQMINILTEQNVQASLAQLQPDDILILPELGAYSAADFSHAWTTVEIGERAAREAAGRLAGLSVSPERYAALQERQAAIRGPQVPAGQVHVATGGLRRVNQESVRAVFNEALRGESNERPSIVPSTRSTRPTTSARSRCAENASRARRHRDRAARKGLGAGLPAFRTEPLDRPRRRVRLHDRLGVPAHLAEPARTGVAVTGGARRDDRSALRTRPARRHRPPLDVGGVRRRPAAYRRALCRRRCDLVLPEPGRPARLRGPASIHDRCGAEPGLPAFLVRLQRGDRLQHCGAGWQFRRGLRAPDR